MQDKENSDQDSEASENPEEVDRTKEASETSRSYEDKVIVVEQPKTEKEQIRSVSSVVDTLQGHCAIATIRVINFTLFSDPFLNEAEFTSLVH